jgi:hypothetical protein
MMTDKTEAERLIEAYKSEAMEQARIIGMGAERELALRAELERMTNNRDMWRAQCQQQAAKLEQFRIDAAKDKP